MSEVSDKTLLFHDFGLFVSWGTTLAKEFGRVLVYVPWEGAFPKSNQFAIGEGLPNVEKVVKFWDAVPEADIVMFGDVYSSDIQNHLRSIGKPVWGSGYGDELELDRWGTKKLLKEIGLPVQHCARVVGLDDLREYLKENENVYVKTSLMRGDMETWHSVRYELSEPRLDELEHALGARKHDKEFVVEDAIDDALEVGYDGFTIDGQFPQKSILGVEQKDLAYIGVVMPYTQFPQKVRYVNEKLSPILAQYQYRNFFSTEIRLGRDKEPFLTDPCCRMGSPPSEVYQQMADNWGQVVWAGAHGELVEPNWITKYGVEALIHSHWANQNNEAVWFPEKISEWIKLRNVTKHQDRWEISPQQVALPEIGAVVATDNTLLGAIKKLKEYSGMIEGYDVTIQLPAILDVLRAISEGQAKGIHFTSDPLPSPAQVEKLIA